MVCITKFSSFSATHIVQVSNGALFMPNTHFMQEITRRSFDNYLDAIDNGHDVAYALYLTISKGKESCFIWELDNNTTKALQYQSPWPCIESEIHDLPFSPHTLWLCKVCSLFKMAFIQTSLIMQLSTRPSPISMQRLAHRRPQKNGWKRTLIMKHSLIILRSGWTARWDPTRRSLDQTWCCSWLDATRWKERTASGIGVEIMQ